MTVPRTAKLEKVPFLIVFVNASVHSCPTRTPPPFGILLPFYLPIVKCRSSSVVEGVTFYISEYRDVLPFFSFFSSFQYRTKFTIQARHWTNFLKKNYMNRCGFWGLYMNGEGVFKVRAAQPYHKIFEVATPHPKVYRASIPFVFFTFQGYV